MMKKGFVLAFSITFLVTFLFFGEVAQGKSEKKQVNWDEFRSKLRTENSDFDDIFASASGKLGKNEGKESESIESFFAAASGKTGKNEGMAGESIESIFASASGKLGKKEEKEGAEYSPEEEEKAKKKPQFFERIKGRLGWKSSGEEEKSPERSGIGGTLAGLNTPGITGKSGANSGGLSGINTSGITGNISGKKAEEVATTCGNADKMAKGKSGKSGEMLGERMILERDGEIVDPALLLLEQKREDEAAILLYSRIEGLLPPGLTMSENHFLLADLMAWDGAFDMAWQHNIISLAYLTGDQGAFFGMDHYSSLYHAWNLMGDIQWARKNGEKAEFALLKTLEIAKNCKPGWGVKTLQKLGEIAVKSKEYDKAKKLINRALAEAEEEKAQGMLNKLLGDIYYDEYQLDKALSHYRVAMRAGFDKGLARIKLCEGLISYENHAQAGMMNRVISDSLPILKQAVELDENFVPAIYMTGYIQYLVGRGEDKPELLENAVKLMARVYQLDPGYEGFNGNSPTEIIRFFEGKTGE